MTNRHHTTEGQRKADRERSKAVQKAQREAVEVCRMLAESWMPEQGAYALSELSDARQSAQRVIDQIDGVKQ